MDTLPSLTRVEAQERAALLEVERYDIDVDLMDMLEGDRLPGGVAPSGSRAATRAPRPSSTRRSTWCRRRSMASPIGADQISAGRIQLDDLAGDNVLIVESVQPRDRAGNGSTGRLTRRTRRSTSGPRSSPTSPARLGLLRPARPQGAARLHRGRTRRPGRS